MEILKHRKVFLLIMAMVLGYASWELPRILVPGTEQVEIFFFGSVKTNIELSRNISILCQILSGMVFGFLDPKRGPLWGAATMLPIFVLATLDAVLGLSPHNLFGIEIIMYTVFTIPPILGALVGGFIKWLILKVRTITSKETKRDEQ